MIPQESNFVRVTFYINPNEYRLTVFGKQPTINDLALSNVYYAGGSDKWCAIWGDLLVHFDITMAIVHRFTITFEFKRKSDSEPTYHAQYLS